MIGKTISHYHILEKLGEGGMGVVYKAEDTKLKRTVALKFLPHHLLVNEEDKTRFLHEAQAAAALSHPHIATVYEIDEVESETFIAMEYIEGESVSEKIKSRPLKLEDALGIGIQAAEGLQEAHEKGIVHRDIKSGNIMVTEKGQAKIMDFGLAKLAGQTKLTKEGTTLGTVAYMSPEQAQGEAIDHRTDIWSLGVILYEMVTGQLPFKGDYEQAVMYSIMNEEPESMTGLRTGVPMELERITIKALAKNPDERYQHLDEVLVDLRSITRDVESQRMGIKERPKKRKRALPYVIVSSLVILFIIVNYYLFTEGEEAIDSIAVLPLENLSGDPEQEYFVDGMHEALMTRLSKIGALKVISRTSVMRYKETNKSLPEIARELRVDAVIEGSVLHIGDRVRINAQLIRSATDERLWAESYDRDLRDVLTLHSEVAQAIARSIKITVTSEEEARLAQARPVDPEAYELYLNGRRHQDRVTEEDLKKSIEYFNQALEKDPNFASAYLGLAESYLYIVWQGGSSEEILSKFRTHALKAIEIDKTMDEAHYLLGELKLYNDWDLSGAELELKRALELNPNSAKAHVLYSFLLQITGRMDEAVAEQEKALEIDPLSHRVACNAGFTYYQARSYDRAIEQARKTTEMFGPACESEDLVIGQAYDQKGMYGNAIDALEKRRNLTKNNARIIAEIGYAYALSGQTNEVHKIIKELKELAIRKFVDPYVMAPIYVALGDKNEAFRLLEKAYEQRSYFLLWVNVDPRFDPLRSDQRFTVLVNKVGIEE